MTPDHDARTRQRRAYAVYLRLDAKVLFAGAARASSQGSTLDLVVGEVALADQPPMMAAMLPPPDEGDDSSGGET